MTHPESMTSASVAWTKAMAKRARKHADAVVVPSHALAEELARYVDLGDRVRVIGGAVSPRIVLPEDPDARAAELDLPAEYLLTVGSLEPRKGVQALVQALVRPETGDLPLLIVGPATWGDVELAQVADEAGVDPSRVRSLGSLTDADLAVALDRATVFVHPSLSEGFGLPVVEALSFGTPVVHSTRRRSSRSRPTRASWCRARIPTATRCASPRPSAACSPTRRRASAWPSSGRTAHVPSAGVTPLRRSGSCTPTCRRASRDQPAEPFANCCWIAWRMAGKSGFCESNLGGTISRSSMGWSFVFSASCVK
ncbi:D-inositol-3-phosphate glycosyltransferase [Clavibacter michiganensis subsp. michiganensis]|uniref:D-inositol-3-phosphate glycosyltransferase n=1 Tax=Clavibacter michiganensis subsp. michiganensis TaxID=33013 RepID=A0A251XD37_CLAMM|nr:D-inositol-3-phosphate glycosyltransferase [Clavibacter michiganensis subsp. michiganensis]OUD99990.1 D-inositol-3-phosphate glycosyltransferase [Clavibacter michiganensis subsp. michiganensis]